MSSVFFNSEIKRVLDTLLLPIEIVSPGKMFGYPAYYVGKKLFACVYERSVGLKVPADFAKKLIGTEGVTPFIPYGRRQMKEWVQLTRADPEDFFLDRAVFEQSIKYAASLKQ